MAFGTYNAANGNVTVTRDLGVRDYTIFNNTRCPFRFVLTHSAATGNDAAFTLGPGEGRTYHSNATGNGSTLVGTPIHTAVLAMREVPFADNYDELTDTDSGARVIWSDFAG